jgi:predicted RNA-binding Zn ribbon-like protein
MDVDVDVAVRAAPGEDVSSALALVNTRHVRGGAAVEVLRDPEAARRWLTERSLLPPDSAAAVAAEVDVDVDLGVDSVDTVDTRLRALREAIRALFAARFAGGQPGDADVALVNAALLRAPLIPVLTWDACGPRGGQWRLDVAADPVDVALARIAADALAVLTAADSPEVAPCAAHGCIRWFLRTHAARQWCSNRCGDRVRAARHYARRGTGSSASSAC